MKARFIIGLLTLSGLLAVANRSYACPPPDPYPTAILKVKRGYLADVLRSYLILDRSAVFDGSDSFTTYPGAHIKKYEFDFGDGNSYIETEDFAPDGKFDGITKHSYSNSGNYTADLTVTNTEGSHDGDDCDINVSEDTDVDDLADNWELHYWPSDPPSSHNPDVDEDGDDYSNLVEYIYGTNPTDNTNYPTGSITIAVPDEASFIQNAIDACLLISGINIVVSEGRHYENNINFKGKVITVRSTEPDNWQVVASTIIDAGDSGSVFKFILGETASSILKGLTITGGNADYGGGIRCDGASPTISNCVITDNWANDYGGGIYNDSSSPTVTNCFFIGNKADYDGGGMSNYQNSDPTITNCMFSGNSGYYGGGMSNENDSDPDVTNCTFSGNTADICGGMYNYDTSAPIVTNCIFWGNTDGLDNERSQIYYASGTPEVNYSCIQNLTSNWGVGNTNSDPVFVDAGTPAGADTYFGTRDDGLGIMAYGSCVDKADSTVADFPATDITGRGRVDVPYADNTDSTAADIGAYESPVIWFVKKGTSAGDDSHSWTTAFDELRDALNPLVNTDLAAGDEIWVAQETYKPTDTTDRAISFVLKSGVGIYGGFSGSMTGPQLRDWRGYNKTILSGDIDGDDTLLNNSYHVVTGADGAVLDGFTITGGNASDPVYYGGGICNSYTSPTISNCVIMDNEAVWYGGGMYNYYCSPTVTNCFFIGNKAVSYGGGMYNESSSQLLTNCVFSGNSANRGGGIRNNSGASPTLINCTFSNNSAVESGGGIFRGQNSTVTNCIFWGNKDTYDAETKTWLTDESAQIDSSNLGKPAINYSCVQGWTGVWGGQDNIGSNPQFVDALAPAGDDGDFGTWDDGLRLQAGSSCIDAAAGSFAPPFDILGVKRFDNHYVINTGIGYPDYAEIGAYEFPLRVVVMCWVDESTSAYHKFEGDVTFDDDLLAYRKLIDSSKLRVQSGCLVPLPAGAGGFTTIEGVFPIGYFDPDPVPDHVDPDDPPEGISIYPFPRDADPELTLQTFINHFNRIRGGVDGVVPDYLCLSVDNSSSMTTNTINPSPDYPYDEFKNWIETNYPDTDKKERDDWNYFTKEQWVDEMRIQLQSVIDGL